MLYLDSPAGTGMSYSLNKSEYKTGDLKTAADAHKFLLKVRVLLLLRCYTGFFSSVKSAADLMHCCSGLNYTPSFSPTCSTFPANHMQEYTSPPSQMKLSKVDALFH
jgi:hypothetical protein